VAYFKRLLTGEQIATITTTLGDESERFMLVAEGNDASLWPLIDPTAADLGVLQSTINLPDKIFTVTGKRLGRFSIDARDPLESRTDIRLAKLWASIYLVVTDVSQGDQQDDLFYYGKKLVWRKSLPPSAGSALMFDATSGLMAIASAQTIKDSGPIPEGLYKFKAQVDPQQANVAQANALGDKAVENSREGIQFLPVGGLGPTQPQWGTFRVRLTPVGPNKAPLRTGFYLHNSYKGYTHGCIEVGDTDDEKSFFDYLFEYAQREKSKKRPWLLLKVSYHDAFTTTKGGTTHQGSGRLAD
jgi:hypothetical protein